MNQTMSCVSTIVTLGRSKEIIGSPNSKRTRSIPTPVSPPPYPPPPFSHLYSHKILCSSPLLRYSEA